MARRRKPSPPLKPDRAGNRERPPARKKLAIVAELQQQTNEIMTRARESASKYAAPKRDTWFTRFEARNPSEAAELLEIAVDWIREGEWRERFATMSHFHRFVDCEVTRVNRQSFVAWLHKVSSSL